MSAQDAPNPAREPVDASLPEAAPAPVAPSKPGKRGPGWFATLFLILLLLGGAAAGVWFKLYPLELKRQAAERRALESTVSGAVAELTAKVEAAGREQAARMTAAAEMAEQKAEGTRSALVVQEGRITALENQPNPFTLEKEEVAALLAKLNGAAEVASQSRAELANQLADLQTVNETARQHLANLERNIARLQSVGASIHKSMIKTQVEQLLIMADGQMRLAQDHVSAGALMDAALAQLESAASLGVKPDRVSGEIGAALAIMRNPRNAPLAGLTARVKELKELALESSLPPAPLPEETLQMDAAAAEALAPEHPEWRRYWNRAAAWVARNVNDLVTIRRDPDKSGKPVIKQVPTAITLILDQLELVRLALANGDRKTALELTGRLTGVLPADRAPETPQTRFNQRLAELQDALEGFVPVRLDIPALKQLLDEIFI